jgi:hypothetical protein
VEAVIFKNETTGEDRELLPTPDDNKYQSYSLPDDGQPWTNTEPLGPGTRLVREPHKPWENE